MTFYTGSSYPVAYQGNLFISEWGSNFAYADTGHVVERVVLGASETASSSQVSVFASGFQHPISVVQAPNGSLLGADWAPGSCTEFRRPDPGQILATSSGAGERRWDPERRSSRTFPSGDPGVVR